MQVTVCERKSKGISVCELCWRKGGLGERVESEKRELLREGKKERERRLREKTRREREGGREQERRGTATDKKGGKLSVHIIISCLQ